MTTLLKLLLIAGSAIAIGPRQSTAQTARKEPFSLAIAPVANEVRPGSLVFIKLTVKNTSEGETFGRGGFYAEGLNAAFGYDCRNSAGQPVNKNFASLPGSAHDSPSLKSGESFEQEVPISRACDLDRSGQYEIQVSRKIPKDSQHRVVKSNTIGITVVP